MTKARDLKPGDRLILTLPCEVIVSDVLHIEDDTYEVYYADAVPVEDSGVLNTTVDNDMENLTP